MDESAREEQKNEKRESGLSHNIVYALVSIIILVSFINIYALSGMNNAITGKIAVFEEENKPALIKRVRLS